MTIPSLHIRPLLPVPAATLSASIQGAVTAPTLDILEAAREARNTDAFFARIHDAVPGFAGLTFEDGIPTIYMVDEGRAEFAKSVLARFFAARGKAGCEVRVRQVQYARGDLYDWRLKVRVLFDLPELRSLAVSTGKNRIVLGLAVGASSDGAKSVFRS